MTDYSKNKRTEREDLSAKEQDFDSLAVAFPGRGRPCDPKGTIVFGTDLEIRRPDPDRPRRPARPAVFESGDGPRFSMDAFAQALRDRLSGNSHGWAFAINRNGQLAVADAGGTAIDPGDLRDGDVIGTRDFTPDTRVQVASVSKTITAFAVMRLLEEVGLGINSRIEPFLPAGWQIGPGVEDLQFRHLLTHTSGLNSANQNFAATLSDAGLQTALAQGATPGAPFNYLNVNFSLFRVIIPALWAAAGNSAANNDDAAASAFFYAVYIIEELFGRMNGAIGDDASTSPIEAIPARVYNTPASFQGRDQPNTALWAGGLGWHLSARELAAILAFTAYDDNVLSAGARLIMDAFGLGWGGGSDGLYQGAFGDYLGHGGRIRWGADSNGNRGHVRSGIMKFNLQVEAAFVANSPVAGGNPQTAGILRDAYDAAWS